MRSRLFALAVVCGSMGTGAIAACGSDEGGSPAAGTPDATAPDTSTTGVVQADTGPAAPNAPTIVASDLVVYTGMTASVDAAATTAESFTWVVKSAPQGSTVTTSTLTGATTARPSFVADKTGDYVIELTAKNGSVGATKEVKVQAVAAPLFFMQTNFSEDPPYLEYRTVGADGTNNHTIACRMNGTPDAGLGGNADLISMSMFLSDMGEDWWEAPAGSPSRVAFAEFVNDAGTTTSRLGLGTDQSTCQNPPVKVNPTVEDGGARTGITLMQPRFAPNGSRVAYLEERNSGWVLVTVGHDGQDKQDLARVCTPEHVM